MKTWNDLDDQTQGDLLNWYNRNEPSDEDKETLAQLEEHAEELTKAAQTAQLLLQDLLQDLQAAHKTADHPAVQILLLDWIGQVSDIESFLRQLL